MNLPTFAPPLEVPEELQRKARELGWDEGLVRRALELRVGMHQIEFWQQFENMSKENVIRLLDRRERLMFGTMRVREVVSDDDEALAEMYAHSPEDIGDWQVTTERSPNPFAQLRLQENTNMVIMEDRGVILGAHAHSTRNSIVSGTRLSVHVQTAFRLREEVRGLGLSHLLRMSEGPACSWFGMFNYYYMRSQNLGAYGWIKSYRPDYADALGEAENAVPGLPATVYHITPHSPVPDADVREANPAELEQCVDVINRTHDGLDLFRPYTAEFLRTRLDGPAASLQPDHHSPVYGWKDFCVLEQNGEILACAGLWDRGRDLREVWQHKETGESRVVASTALLDFGYAEGHEDALARVIAYYAGRTSELERDTLIAPLEHLPGVLERLAGYDPEPEARVIQFQVDTNVPELADVNLKRPYTDLAYW